MIDRLGLCTWSLGNDGSRIAETMKRAGIARLHLEVAAADALAERIAENGWTISATMVGFPQEDYSTLDSIRATGGIVPDACWAANRTIALEAIAKTAELGARHLSFHAGFIDHADVEGYAVFRERLRELADAAKDAGVTLLLETGQETAVDLRDFLVDLDHPSVGVNFDPANMILYDKGDPVSAVETLAPWIKHVHVKDAVKTKTPGEWGAETPWGDGEVEREAFISALERIGYAGALAVEREAGEERENDIVLAAERLGERS